MQSAVKYYLGSPLLKKHWRILLQNLYIPLCTDGAIPDLQVSSSIDANVPPYHQTYRRLKLAPITKWLVPRLFRLGHVASNHP